MYGSITGKVQYTDRCLSQPRRNVAAPNLKSHPSVDAKRISMSNAGSHTNNISERLTNLIPHPSKYYSSHSTNDLLHYSNLKSSSKVPQGKKRCIGSTTQSSSSGVRTALHQQWKATPTRHVNMPLGSNDMVSTETASTSSTKIAAPVQKSSRVFPGELHRKNITAEECESRFSGINRRKTGIFDGYKETIKTLLRTSDQAKVTREKRLKNARRGSQSSSNCSSSHSSHSSESMHHIRVERKLTKLSKISKSSPRKRSPPSHVIHPKQSIVDEQLSEDAKFNENLSKASQNLRLLLRRLQSVQDENTRLKSENSNLLDQVRDFQILQMENQTLQRRMIQLEEDLYSSRLDERSVSRHSSLSDIRSRYSHVSDLKSVHSSSPDMQSRSHSLSSDSTRKSSMSELQESASPNSLDFNPTRYLHRYPFYRA